MFGIASGAYDVALVVGADKLRETASKGMLWEWEAMSRDMAWDYPLGLAQAGFALHVRRYLHESPATREHMAMVAVKNHHNAMSNPKACRRFELTVEEALTADTVVTPSGSTTAHRRAMVLLRWSLSPRTWSTGSPIVRSGYVEVASVSIPLCISTSAT